MEAANQQLRLDLRSKKRGVGELVEGSQSIKDTMDTAQSACFELDQDRLEVKRELNLLREEVKMKSTKIGEQNLGMMNRERGLKLMEKQLKEIDAELTAKKRAYDQRVEGIVSSKNQGESANRSLQS